MDHAEEQAMELEALEAIYMEEFERLPPVDGASAFELTLVPETGGEESHVSIAMRVVYTPTYPEEPPALAVRALKGLSSAQAAECEAALVEAARSEDRLGTAMVYSLAEEAQAWMAERNVPEMDMHAEMMARLEVARADGAEAEAADASSAGAAGASAGGLRGRKQERGPAGSWRGDGGHGADVAFTPVSVELFAAWRVEWDAEQIRLREQTLASSAAGRKQAGGAEPALTGRQLFERVGSSDLVLGDAGALGEGEEDAMAAPREAVDDDDDDGGDGGEGGEGGAGADVLMDVGDAALFDVDDLPDDFPDDE